MESCGRERRHRYYTIHHYRQCVSEESLDAAPYKDLDVGNIGGFSIVDHNTFYETEGDTVHYTSSFKSTHDSLEKKRRLYKNPILPDGTVKRGRPRKRADESNVTTVKRPRKRKKVDGEVGESKRPSKKLRMFEASADPPRECLCVVIFFSGLTFSKLPSGADIESKSLAHLRRLKSRFLNDVVVDWLNLPRYRTRPSAIIINSPLRQPLEMA